MSIMKNFLMFAAAIVIASPVLAGSIEIKDPYAKSAGKMAKAGAVFMMLHNHTKVDDRLIAARSNVSEMVQLHTHQKGEDGVIKMRHVPEGFVIPGEGVHSLKRGADHLMFMGLVAPWEHGGSIQLTLVFENAGEITVDVPIDLKRKDMAHSH